MKVKSWEIDFFAFTKNDETVSKKFNSRNYSIDDVIKYFETLKDNIIIEE